jgi:chromosome segregation ATPase
VDFLSKNYAMVTALAAGLVALIGVYLQYRRDKMDAADRVIKTSFDLNDKLTQRITDLESDVAALEKKVDQQNGEYRCLQDKYSGIADELGNVRADRDRLLAERVDFRKQIADQAKQIADQGARIAVLENELALLRTMSTFVKQSAG